MTKTYKHLVIAGSGMVGPVAAIVLQKYFDQITVFEKRADPFEKKENEARSLQVILSARGWRTLELAGVASKIRNITIPLVGRQFHNSEEEIITEKYSAKGEHIACVSRQEMHQVLIHQLTKHDNIRIQYRSEVGRINFKKKTIVAYDSQNQSEAIVNYDFLLGADGVSSNVALALNHMQGREFKTEDIVYKEIHSDVLNLDCNVFHYWNNAYAMMGAFPVRSGGFSLFMVYNKKHDSHLFGVNRNSSFFTDHFPRVVRWEPELQQQFHHAEPGILGAITCNKWNYQDEAVIIGDAAHAVLPFMGQGLNTGLEDVYFLDQAFASKPSRSFIEEFVSSRKPNTEAIQEISRSHFLYLTNQMAKGELEQKAKLENYLCEHQLPTMYELCAFSLESFSDILKRDKTLQDQHR
jgi:kynurenine 3-monooxygenase